MINNCWAVGTLLSCLLHATHQLDLRTHTYYSTPSYYDSKYSSSSDPDDGVVTVIAVIIILGFVAAAGAACYFCCRALIRRSSNTREYVGGPPPPLPQPIYPSQSPYPTAAQPVQVGLPANISGSSNPYGSLSERERMSSACDSCHVRYKQGEQPRAMVGCESKHVFHLSCLGAAVKLQGELLCPACSQRVPEVVKLYCVSCKVSSVGVNLGQFRHAAEGLDLEALRRTYGECCPNCSGL